MQPQPSTPTAGARVAGLLLFPLIGLGLVGLYVAIALSGRWLGPAVLLVLAAVWLAALAVVIGRSLRQWWRTLD